LFSPSAPKGYHFLWGGGGAWERGDVAFAAAAPQKVVGLRPPTGRTSRPPTRKATAASQTRRHSRDSTLRHCLRRIGAVRYLPRHEGQSVTLGNLPHVRRGPLLALSARRGPPRTQPMSLRAISPRTSPSVRAWGCFSYGMVCLFSPSAGVAISLFVGRRQPRRDQIPSSAAAPQKVIALVAPTGRTSRPSTLVRDGRSPESSSSLRCRPQGRFFTPSSEFSAPR